MTDKRIQILKKIAKESGLRGFVAQEVLDYGENHLDNFFSDLFQHGCISGMIGSLIYYADTHAFFDKHYDEIEYLRIEFEDSTSEKLSPESNDLKNWFAWFAFEETARMLADELEE